MRATHTSFHDALSGPLFREEEQEPYVITQALPIVEDMTRDELLRELAGRGLADALPACASWLALANSLRMARALATAS